jgi:ParB family transcriptional regulator, chromosome partitioning protein
MKSLRMNSDNPKRSHFSNCLQSAFGDSRDPIFGVSRDFPRVVELDLAEIRPNPDQPRKTFDKQALEELAASINKHGLIQPITVKKVDDSCLLVAGERQLCAHQMLSRETIFAIVTTGNADEIALIENIQREDLNPLEEAEAMTQLMERHRYTQKELGKVISKKQKTVSEILRLTALPDTIKREYRTSDITVPKSVLIEITRLPTGPEQLALWEQIKQGATVRAVRQKKQGDTRHPSPAEKMLATGRSFARQLRSTMADDLGANRGLRELRYKSQIERDHLGAHLRQLRRVGLIRQYEIERNARGDGPGVGFFSDYDPFYPRSTSFSYRLRLNGTSTTFSSRSSSSSTSTESSSTSRPSTRISSPRRRPTSRPSSSSVRVRGRSRSRVLCAQRGSEHEV